VQCHCLDHYCEPAGAKCCVEPDYCKTDEAESRPMPAGAVCSYRKWREQNEDSKANPAVGTHLKVKGGNSSIEIRRSRCAANCSLLQFVSSTEGQPSTRAEVPTCPTVLKSETWLQRSTYQMAPECLPTSRLGCILNMDSFWRTGQEICYYLSDLINLLRQTLTDRPMGLKDRDKGRQLLRPKFTLVLRVGG